MPRYLQLLCSISMKCGIILGIIAEANTALRNNDLAATEETRIKRKGAGAKQDQRGGYRSQIEGNKCTDVLFPSVLKNGETLAMRKPTVAAALAAGVRKPTTIAAPRAMASDPTAQTLTA